MVEIEKYGNFKPLGKNKKKYQLILTHSSRDIENYLQSLKYRYNGKNKKIPNYIITKSGKVLNLIDDNGYCEYFTDSKINEYSIIVCLENLGWLQKEPLKDYYVNWIGDIYKGIPFERKWREYFFWDPYTDEQINSTVELVNFLFKKNKIKRNIVGHNTKLNGVHRYEGLVTKSNYEMTCTEINPSFDFERFIKKIDNDE